MTGLANAQDTSYELDVFEQDRTEQRRLNLSAYGIGPEQLQALDRIGTMVAPHLDDMLDRFFQAMRAKGELAQFFHSEHVYAHAKAKQKQHWVRMMSSNVDSGAYAASCDIIGATHFRIGVPFEHYMASYGRVMGELQTIVMKASAGQFGGVRTTKVGPLLDTLSRVIVMDMERAVAAFFNADRMQSMERFSDMSTALEGDVNKIAQGVSASSAELSSTSNQMVQTGNYARSEAATASRLSEEMDANVQGVASAVEELSASIRSISDQLAESTAVSKRARIGATSAGETMQDLDKAVADISSVLEMISSIAKQTNLLALNATVEAARSGDAGRGFAVVALEIKSLSERISGATKEIDTRIAHIRSRTKDAVIGTSNIAEAITSLDASTSSIAAAVSQQSTATADIASSAETTASRTSRMAESIQKLDRAVSEISGSAEQVAKASCHFHDRALEIRARTADFAQDMSRI